ncbi:MAG TPA: hypothetical protein VGK61_00615 [Planctomycetota bacterium]|jgi:hypothetical protein
MTRLPAALLIALLIQLPAVPQEVPPKKVVTETERTKTLQKELTTLRGLEFTREVTVGTYTRDELLAFLKKELEREHPREEVDRVRKALVHFGLIPADLDLYQTVIELLGASIAGFYHPKTKELRLIKPGEGVPDDEETMDLFGIKINLHEVTLIHELCHAAQDQNFDLNTLPMELKTNDDLVMAVQSLVEGDATVVGLKYGFKDKFDAVSTLIGQDYKDGGLGEEAAKFPIYLRKTLTFPYGYGADFVVEILNRAKGDWSAVSKAFSDLPSSTEQILHPKKYFGPDRDYPQALTLEGLWEIIGGGWKEIYSNVHGEFGARLVLDEFKVATARGRRKAAEGWDGDRYYVFENGKGALAGVWFTVWDTEEDAREFFDAYALLLQAKHEGAERESADQKLTLSKGAIRAVLERRGAEVLVFDGFGAEESGKINKAWSAAKKTEIRKVDRVPAKETK